MKINIDTKDCIQYGCNGAAVFACFRHHPELSLQQIAETLGISHATVRKLYRELKITHRVVPVYTHNKQGGRVLKGVQVLK